MGKRPGMVLYHDKYHALDQLNDHDFRAVIDALMHYSETGESISPDGVLGVIYQLMAAKLEDDIARYDRTSEKRRDAIKKRWSTDTNEYKCIQMYSNEYKPIQTDTNEYKPIQTDTNDTNQNLKPKPKTKTQNQTSSSNDDGGATDDDEFPSVSDVEKFADTIGVHADPEAFVSECANRAWRDNDGKPIRDWRAWFRGWAKNRGDDHGRSEDPSRHIGKWDRFV